MFKVRAVFQKTKGFGHLGIHRENVVLIGFLTMVLARVFGHREIRAFDGCSQQAYIITALSGIPRSGGERIGIPSTLIGCRQAVERAQPHLPARN
jgi:hypothetical protein